MSEVLETRPDILVRKAVVAAKLFGANTAREAAEMALRRQLSDEEWAKVREAWERTWYDS